MYGLERLDANEQLLTMVPSSQRREGERRRSGSASPRRAARSR